MAAENDNVESESAFLTELKTKLIEVQAALLSIINERDNLRDALSIANERLKLVSAMAAGAEAAHNEVRMLRARLHTLQGGRS